MKHLKVLKKYESNIYDTFHIKLEKNMFKIICIFTAVKNCTSNFALIIFSITKDFFPNLSPIVIPVCPNELKFFSAY